MVNFQITSEKRHQHLSRLLCKMMFTAIVAGFLMAFAAIDPHLPAVGQKALPLVVTYQHIPGLRRPGMAASSSKFLPSTDDAGPVCSPGPLEQLMLFCTPYQIWACFKGLQLIPSIPSTIQSSGFTTDGV